MQWGSIGTYEDMVCERSRVKGILAARAIVKEELMCSGGKDQRRGGRVAYLSRIKMFREDGAKETPQVFEPKDERIPYCRRNVYVFSNRKRGMREAHEGGDSASKGG